MTTYGLSDGSKVKLTETPKGFDIELIDPDGSLGGVATYIKGDDFETFKGTTVVVKSDGVFQGPKIPWKLYDGPKTDLINYVEENFKKAPIVD